MKNKKNIYVLLPAVILVWGLLGYRIFSTVKPSITKTPQLTVTEFNPKKLEETAPFTISANYRDPFLGSLTRKKSVKKSVVKVTSKKPKTPFPIISYKGMISSEGKHAIFLIAISGKQFFFKNKATYQEVKLVRGSKKQVVVQFKGQRKTIVISK